MSTLLSLNVVQRILNEETEVCGLSLRLFVSWEYARHLFLKVLLDLGRDIIRGVIQNSVRITLGNISNHGRDVDIVVNSYLLPLIDEVLFEIDRILLCVTLTLAGLRLLLLLYILVSSHLIGFDLLLLVNRLLFSRVYFVNRRLLMPERR